MASSSEAQHNKTVTGYPVPPNQVATGYPATAIAAAEAATTDNAYTYAYPPRSSFSAATYRPFRHISDDHPIRRTLLHRAFFFCMTAFLVMVLFVLTSYIALKPHLPEFRVDSAAISQLNLTQSELTATWLFTLLVKNPNDKLRIQYDRLKASVFYGDELELATNNLPPFFQDRNNESTVKFQLDAITKYVGEDAVEEISKERDSGSIDFGVRVFAWVRYRTGIWRMSENVLRVYCNPIQIGDLGINGTGTSVGQSKKCQVYL
ncbi:hypothetical protein JCGZ_08770 [Jatropha curcas]|uniref:Late embryogenesis abundant protein LEA-2 subgroup domain-containing protein n=2 Tax=Jatropha curcas TaxID=180498 RepID=A0A067KIR9_JATCU|nr:hypothetical protein JCGZ_08770 [Jatropha curcas]